MSNHASLCRCSLCHPNDAWQYAERMSLARENMDLIGRLTLATKERDEAREWARHYKKRYEESCDAELGNFFDYLNESAKLAECERKYKQATCEHENGATICLEGTSGTVVVQVGNPTCIDCGKEL